ncbi:hypothetical protein ROP_pKNR-00570 (plasmid) [Rhodococcus opacus B4]|uniref:Uncharacterized protein n=1 Tax=Rhodococcus opacus (strain B4) TaxID=632772 RepID=C1BEA9_RHOOB|nr:hypothetical protein ROP_pKNR-00570 [Rhodococcus opacus B4]
MTEPGNQLSQLDLFISCAVPTCDFPVVEPGDVCTGCQDEFGHMLRARPAAPCVSPQLDPAHSAGIPEQNRTSRTSSATDELTRSQRCWLCEERRTCTKVRGRWECRGCTRG